MKAKLGIKDVEYIIQDDVVICLLQPAYSWIDKALTGTSVLADASGISYPLNTYENYLPSYFKGIARRKPGDEPNIEIAKQIARKKAYRNMCKNYRAVLGMFIDKQIQVTQAYLELLDSLNCKIDEVDEEILNTINGDI